MKRRLILSVAGVVVVLAGLMVTPLVLRQVVFFRVRQVELIGVQYLVPDELLNALDLTPDQSVFDDLEVLEDQLIGVDSAYFMDVIRRLKAKGQGEIDTAYLVEVIDRVF